LIERTQSLLGQVQALHDLVESLRNDLIEHEEALLAQLALLEAEKPPEVMEQPKPRKLAPAPIVTEKPPPAAAPELKAVHGKERRASLRRKGNPVSVQVSDVEAMAEPFSGWIVDRSLGGVCVLTDFEFPVGTRLTVRPASAPETFPWIHTAVRSCRQERSSWKLGLQFAQPVTWEELRMFG
jgi:hypothetical protein